MSADFALRWERALLGALSEGKTGGELFAGCARCHFDELGLAETLKPFAGDLDGLIAFLEREWGWIIRKGEDGRSLTADENKQECVCPVRAALATGEQEAPKCLCDCSARFAELLFSSAVGHKVRARVKRSVIRDGESCVYEVDLR